MKKPSLMGHLVIGYPSLEESFKTALTYIEQGIDYLELQIPFSDPTADGPIITIANKVAIKNNTKLENCFNFIQNIRKLHENVNIYVMTYANKIISKNWENIENKLVELNIKNLIIPDLPFDSKDAELILYNNKIKLVPVIGINITEKRLEKILENKPDFIYIMSGFKTTGSSFEIDNQMENTINLIRKKSNTKIGIGFGISCYKDVKQTMQIADVAIVGSAFIKAKNENKLEDKIKELINS